LPTKSRKKTNEKRFLLNVYAFDTIQKIVSAKILRLKKAAVAAEDGIFIQGITGPKMGQITGCH
jgi:hypothetical protein